MDLSSPAKREAAIRAELVLNRRTAPELYLAVVPVTREAGGGLALGGSGEPVEWLLEMQRFPAEMQLDRVATRGGLTSQLLEALARTIADFHDRAEHRPDHGGSDAMREVVQGNADGLAGLVPSVFEAEPTAALAGATVAEFNRSADLLDQRRSAGAVRRCHGDLHLANIVLLRGRPVPFDCLEFSEDLASIDVLYDLAFLVMDLLERGLRPEAWRLLQAYNDRREEDEGLGLLPLFLSIRAAVRAKVVAYTAISPSHARDRDRLIGQARAYLELARAALEPVPPVLVAIGGRSGTGKSTIAAAVAPLLGAMPGAVLLRSDIIRKRLMGHEPAERLPAGAYSPDVTRQVYRRMVERADVLLRAGRSVVCDAVYGEEVERWAIAGAAAGLEVPFRAFWLEAPEPVLEVRVTTRAGDASDADAAVVRAQRGLAGCETVGWRRICADRPLDELITQVLTALQS
jgi:aminoglycoside phosphotransferase family enzyme/predicted kinase